MNRAGKRWFTGEHPGAPTDEACRMDNMRASGATLGEMGAAFGVTSERCRQVLAMIERKKRQGIWQVVDGSLVVRP